MSTGDPSSISAAGGNVPDLPELRVEPLHDELALADEPVDDQAVGVALVAEHDHRQLGARGERCGHLQHLVRGDQPDPPAVEIEVLPPFELRNLLVRQLERPDDGREREGVGLATDLREQRAHDRQRDRQLQPERRPEAGLRVTRARRLGPASPCPARRRGRRRGPTRR